MGPGQGAVFQGSFAGARATQGEAASYIAGSRLMVVLTAPLLYLCIAPLVLSDLAVTAYQAVCFPIYGIPKVRRANYFVFDRHRLRYLNLVERLNCLYCSYANGLFAYGTEIAARTEQYWCPIKHAKAIVEPHSRYSRYLDYGAAEAYRRRLETLRRDFNDVRGAVRSNSRAG